MLSGKHSIEASDGNKTVKWIMIDGWGRKKLSDCFAGKNRPRTRVFCRNRNINETCDNHDVRNHDLEQKHDLIAKNFTATRLPIVRVSVER